MAAQRKLNMCATKAPAAPSPAPPRLRAADASAAAKESPALHLQQQLYGAYEGRAGDVPAEERWSPRRTAVFLFMSCAGFWAAVICTVSLIV